VTHVSIEFHRSAARLLAKPRKGTKGDTVVRAIALYCCWNCNRPNKSSREGV